MAVEPAVLLDRPQSFSCPGDQRVRLRAGVLHLGGLLGWEPREVISFAEAVAGCPWRHFGCAEFEMVLEEYRAITEALRGKRKSRSQRVAIETDTAFGDGDAPRD